LQYQVLAVVLLLCHLLGPVISDGNPDNGQEDRQVGLALIQAIATSEPAYTPTDHVACQSGNPRCQLDQRAFEAITRLHSLLDDDKNGAVDAAEAEGFAREELAYATDFERASAINREDPGVSTRELWSLWRASDTYNWTADEVHLFLYLYYNDFYNHHIRYQHPIIDFQDPNYRFSRFQLSIFKILIIDFQDPNYRFSRS
uniref:EF-hand domain-containing protein n=1 Tax=Macrostomum lignano TaxID=282301 RepID=A0A1I8HH51_9PLAT